MPSSLRVKSYADTRWVEQRQLWRPGDHPDGPQRGDCGRASLASLFGVPYEATEGVDGTYTSYDNWTREHFPGLACESRMLGDTWAEVETLDSWREWPTEHNVRGYWIATVYSHRIPDEERFGCGCADRMPGGDPKCKWCHGEPDKRPMGIQWGLHAVVMKHGECDWDPHPERAKGFGPFRCATRWYAADPAQIPGGAR